LLGRFDHAVVVNLAEHGILAYECGQVKIAECIEACPVIAPGNIACPLVLGDIIIAT
jgi:hypothetical protein